MKIESEEEKDEEYDPTEDFMLQERYQLINAYCFERNRAYLEGDSYKGNLDELWQKLWVILEEKNDDKERI